MCGSATGYQSDPRPAHVALPSRKSPPRGAGTLMPREVIRVEARAESPRLARRQPELRGARPGPSVFSPLRWAPCASDPFASSSRPTALSRLPRLPSAGRFSRVLPALHGLRLVRGGGVPVHAACLGGTACLSKSGCQKGVAPPKTPGRALQHGLCRW